jgi:hypothetical protein
MTEAKVRVSVLEGTIEIEGTESFVSVQLEKFGDSIRAGLTAERKEQRAGGGGSTPDKGNAGAGSTSVGELDDMFAATETGVQVLKDIPGGNNTEKMANAGKLLAYGMAKVKNKDTVLFEDVKAVCKTHGCYDGNNMAKALKAEKTAFVFGGRGKKQTIKLTKPGTNEVEKMIQALRAPNATE